MKMMITAGLLFCCLSAPASGQNPTKLKIYVSCTCNDPVGVQYASTLRDVIAQSPRYTLASNDGEKDEKGKFTSYNWVMNVVTTDDDLEGNKGLATAISIVLTVGGFDLGQYVQVCGANKVQLCAQRALAMVDHDLNTR